MSNKEKIIKIYYEEHQKQTIIAKNIGVKQSYVSQVVKNDEQYSKEKEYRHNKSIIKKAEYNKNYNKTYKRAKKNDDSYKQLQAQLVKDSMELSSAGRCISDYDFAKWNLSVYHRNKKGNLALISGIIVGADVPRTVNMNVKVPTQRHKHKCCTSY